MNCRSISTETVCYTAADGTRLSLVAHYVYGPSDNADGLVIISTRYTLADGETVVDTSKGTVTPGSCEAPQYLEVVGCLPGSAIVGAVVSILSKLDPSMYAAAGAPWSTFVNTGNVISGTHNFWQIYESCDPTLVGTPDPNGHIVQSGPYTANPDIASDDVFALSGNSTSCSNGGTVSKAVKVIQKVNHDGTVVIHKVYSIDGTGTLVEEKVLDGLILGCCPKDEKTPATTHVYVSAPGSVTIPADTYREFIVHNRNLVDVVLKWATATGVGTLVIPAKGSYILSLTDEKMEGYFTSIAVGPGLYGVGSFKPNALVFTFKN